MQARQAALPTRKAQLSPLKTVPAVGPIESLGDEAAKPVPLAKPSGSATAHAPVSLTHPSMLAQHKRRSTSLESLHPSQNKAAAAPQPVRLTKNYLDLVHDFRMFKPFMRLPGGSYPSDAKCVFCEVNAPVNVFFPCQHRCVCNGCMKMHKISANRSDPSVWSACPVCMSDIRLILPHTGDEEERYWAWVTEAKPPIPTYFKNEFKDAAKRLRTSMIVPLQSPEEGAAYAPTTTINERERPRRRHSAPDDIATPNMAASRCTIL